VNTSTTGLTGMSGSTVGTTGGVAGSTISGITPARDVPGPHLSHTRETLSRHNSVTSSRRSEASSPSLSSSLHQGDHFPSLLAHRQSGSSQHGHFTSPPTTQQMISSSNHRSSFVPSNVATARYEEAAYHRSELEVAKRENEALRKRIRELERTLTSRRESDAGRVCTDSASMGGPASGSLQRLASATDDDEDAVGVGESAGSVGFGGGR